MKFRYLYLVILLATPLHAEQMSKQEFCNYVEEVTAKIMELRQEGVPMRKVMEALPEAQEMIISAYEESRFKTPEYQQEAIREFSDKYYLSCVKNMDKLQ